MAYLKVRVTPGGGEDAIGDWLGDALRVRVTAPPERGKANEAVCRLIAGKLGLPRSHVTVAKGIGARTKLVFVEGLTDEQLMAQLQALPP